MGISSDGIFFYGLLWEDEEEPWKSPTPDEVQKAKYGDPDWEELYEMRSGKNPGGSHVEIGIHCSLEYSMYYMAVKETRVVAPRGYPKQEKVLTVKPEWEALLRDFCKVLGIKWREPAWWVTSLYG